MPIYAAYIGKFLAFVEDCFRFLGLEQKAAARNVL